MRDLSKFNLPDTTSTGRDLTKFSLPDVGTPNPDERPADASSLGWAAKNYWEQVNPMQTVRLAEQFIHQPKSVIEGIARGIWEPLWDKAVKSYKEGDRITAARHILNIPLNVLPGVGNVSDEMTDQFMRGDVAGGIGTFGGLATNLSAPYAASKLKVGMARPNKVGMARPNEVLGEAIASEEAAGTHIPANVFGKGTLAEIVTESPGYTLSGAMTKLISDRKTTASLRGRIKGLSNEVSPKGGITLEEASSGIETFNDIADYNYQVWRDSKNNPLNIKKIKTGEVTTTTKVVDINNKPFTKQVETFEEITHPINIERLQSQLKPIIKEYERAWDETRRKASPVYNIMNQIVADPKVVSAIDLELDMGTLKGIVREVDNPNLRDRAHGLASYIKNNIEPQIDAAATKAGILTEIKAARIATVRKHAMGDIADILREGPVSYFNKPSAKSEATLNLIKKLDSVLPEETSRLGYTYMEGLGDLATKKGAFEKGNALESSWQKMPDPIKRILFKKAGAGYIENVDKFLRVAAESSNKLGKYFGGNLLGIHAITGAGQVGGIYLMLHNPTTGALIALGSTAVSMLLNSSRGVKLLTRGLQLPINSSVVARSAVATGILNIINQGVQPQDSTNITKELP